MFTSNKGYKHVFHRRNYRAVRSNGARRRVLRSAHIGQR